MLNMAVGLHPSIMEMNCQLHWRLTMFFIDCDKGIIRSSQVRIIFQLFLSILEEKQMACEDSKDIYICSKELQQLTNMPHIHLIQLRDSILSMLVLSHSGRPINNPTENYKILLRRLFPQHQTSNEQQGRGQLPIQAVSPQRILWTMDSQLSILLIGYASDQPVEFRFILNLMLLYISDNRATLCHPLNMEIACIRQSPLYQIFGISYIHRSQIRGILRDHVTPVTMD